MFDAAYWFMFTLTYTKMIIMFTCVYQKKKMSTCKTVNDKNI